MESRCDVCKRLKEADVGQDRGLVVCEDCRDRPEYLKYCILRVLGASEYEPIV
jgi:hypothetical protein